MKYVFSHCRLFYGYEVLYKDYSDILRDRSTLAMVDFDDVEDYQIVVF